MTRTLVALLLVALPLASAGACSGNNRMSAAATKPMGPANGAGDYKDNPGGPHGHAVVPVASGEPNAPGSAIEHCPPSCNADGSWTGCGLKKPRGNGCKGCEPKCKGKSTIDEGWYDCNGVLIAARNCE